VDVLVIGSINVDLVVQTPQRPAPGVAAGSVLMAAATAASQVAAIAVTGLGAQPSYPTKPRAAQAPR